jgi:hypothetical protein
MFIIERRFFAHIFGAISPARTDSALANINPQA